MSGRRVNVTGAVYSAECFLNYLGVPVSTRNINAQIRTALGHGFHNRVINEELKKRHPERRSNNPSGKRGTNSAPGQHQSTAALGTNLTRLENQEPVIAGITAAYRARVPNGKLETENPTRYARRAKDGAEPVAKKKRIRVDVPDVDFGDDETLVQLVIAASTPSGQMEERTLKSLRAQLFSAREKFGVELWRSSSEKAAAKPAGVRYALAIMRDESTRTSDPTAALPFSRSPTHRNGNTGKFVHYDG
ncbi:MAG: hypothetical protein ACREMT_12060, partial [Vulcanimicrobiaceae bacterium]